MLPNPSNRKYQVNNFKQARVSACHIHLPQNRLKKSEGRNEQVWGIRERLSRSDPITRRLESTDCCTSLHVIRNVNRHYICYSWAEHSLLYNLYKCY